MIGGLASLLASLAHLACIAMGASWFRFFGAPEPLVVEYENGAMGLVWMTIGIAIVLAIWAAYAFSGARKLPRLPLLRSGLPVIASIYLLRGLVLFPALASAPYPGQPFDIWSSAIVLAIGLAYAIGTALVWPQVHPTRAAAA
ncbi:hypothetical protein [Erythrobacter rubeus]|uniref:Uncharacterized protein n=1 Tax=Erythrobacter rubeus TaxID=2760803 RepID=A0ABR8KWK4_9SPHN|nr:hypothetical protein [Erythrobacter rubeus]MBD2843453.1 hypothetical protein [Erythrobacter rubeus]